MRKYEQLSEVKVLCFHIKEKLVKILEGVQNHRDHIFETCSATIGPMSQTTVKKDLELLLYLKVIPAASSNQNKSEIHQSNGSQKSQQYNTKTDEEAKHLEFFDNSYKKFMIFRNQFVELNEYIDHFMKSSKPFISHSISVSKKLLENLHSIRIQLYKYFRVQLIYQELLNSE